MALKKPQVNAFAQRIRSRRRALDVTQEEVAHRIGTTTPYVGHLEAGKRHPSEKVVVKLADALGIDRAELFLLANPQAEAILAQATTEPSPDSPWEEFRKDKRLHRIHNISPQEMDLLSRVDMMGRVRSARDFLFIINTVRQAFGR
ncbi:MAG TPA: helix-turn-helix transcriptional regulator [Candidatus Binataceae bacterium]|nr:helix-turn-helix transcriptional regulator [Candidatus Binataceae bacterium]